MGARIQRENNLWIVGATTCSKTVLVRFKIRTDKTKLLEVDLAGYLVTVHVTVFELQNVSRITNVIFCKFCAANCFHISAVLNRNGSLV